jgi:hypothetical protein
MREPTRASDTGSDLYSLLEVSPTASQEVIQAAYRALVRNWHPDINPTAEAALRIRQLNEAHDVLSDATRRAGYDLERVRRQRRERLVASMDNNAPARAPTSPRPEADPRLLLVHTRGRKSGRAIDSIRSSYTTQLIIVLAVIATFLIAVTMLLWVGLTMVDDRPVDHVRLVEISSH